MSSNALYRADNSVDHGNIYIVCSSFDLQGSNNFVVVHIQLTYILYEILSSPKSS
jgi:hypothetical protein